MMLRAKAGLFANVPTWKDIGVDMTTSSWRTVMAPKGLTAEADPHRARDGEVSGLYTRNL